jgi:hypothetical protein
MQRNVCKGHADTHILPDKSVAVPAHRVSGPGLARPLLRDKRRSHPPITETAAMDTFAPEFAHFWLDGQRGDADVTNGEFGALDTPTQQAKLVELAERVSAARSVV